MKKTGSIAIKILFFGFGLIVFFSAMFFMVNIINNNKEAINTETKSSTDCLYLDFKIEKVAYKNDQLSVTINNPSSNKYEINKINLKNNNNLINKEFNLKTSETKTVQFDNITISNNMFISANECLDYEKKLVIQ